MIFSPLLIAPSSCSTYSDTLSSPLSKDLSSVCSVAERVIGMDCEQPLYLSQLEAHSFRSFEHKFAGASSGSKQVYVNSGLSLVEQARCAVAAESDISRYVFVDAELSPSSIVGHCKNESCTASSVSDCISNGKNIFRQTRQMTSKCLNNVSTNSDILAEDIYSTIDAKLIERPSGISRTTLGVHRGYISKMKLLRVRNNEWRVVDPSKEGNLRSLMLSNKCVHEGPSTSSSSAVFGVKRKTHMTDTEFYYTESKKQFSDQHIYVSCKRATKSRMAAKFDEKVSYKPNLCVLPTKRHLSAEEKCLLMKLRFEQLDGELRKDLLKIIGHKLGGRTLRKLRKNPSSGTCRKPNTVHLAIPRVFECVVNEDVASDVWEQMFMSHKSLAISDSLFNSDLIGEDLYMLRKLENWVFRLHNNMRLSLYKIINYGVSFTEYKSIRESFMAARSNTYDAVLTSIFFPGMYSSNLKYTRTDKFLNMAFKCAAMALFTVSRTKKKCGARILSNEEEQMMSCLSSGWFNTIQEVERMLYRLKLCLSKRNYNKCQHLAIDHLLNKGITE